MSFTYTTLSKASKLLSDIATFKDGVITVPIPGEGLTYAIGDDGGDFLGYDVVDNDGQLVQSDDLVSISVSPEELAESVRKLTEDWAVEIISKKEV